MGVQAAGMLEETIESYNCSADQGSEEGETILLVEDEPFVREVTCEILRSAGYCVVTARNASEGASVYYACRGAVNLLLTDVVLPGETGRTLAGRLRRRDPGLKVLLVSGYTEQMVLSHRMQEELLEKPFSSEVLLRRVKELLSCGKPLESKAQFMHACGIS
jgi:DNA-binding response OmpR family regulator